jgi:hypothetical protein
MSLRKKKEWAEIMKVMRETASCEFSPQVSATLARTWGTGAFVLIQITNDNPDERGWRFSPVLFR